MSTETKIIDIIKDALSVKDARLGDKLGDDLGADSLDRLEVVMELEAAFDIEIPDELGDRIVTVQDAVEYVSALVHGEEGGV
jgi:acyl carrier protein